MSEKRTAIRKCRLTELAVKKAQPEAAAYAIWDTLQRGLCLRIQPSGSRAWYCVYSRQGRPRWLYLGAAAAIGLADARTMAAEAMLQVARGKDPAAEKRAERSKGTFQELHERYLNEHAKKHNRSWPQAAALVRRFALPYWGKLQASTISRSDVKTMMARIQAPIVANQTLAAVSAIFSWGVTEEIVTGNPCKLVNRNPVKSRERVLADSELPQFWKAFDDAGLVAGTALKIILLCGQRPGEVRHMRREHLVDGWWQMPGEPVLELGWPGTKNGQGHRVWLSQPVRDLIAELGDETASSGFVFAGGRGSPVGKFDSAMRAICTKLGVEKLTPHDLRRSFSSRVTGSGFGRDAMNRVTNHKEGGIADVYDRHQYAEEDRRIMETVAARILALGEGRSLGDNVVAMARS